MTRKFFFESTETISLSQNLAPNAGVPSIQFKVHWKSNSITFDYDQLMTSASIMAHSELLLQLKY